MLIALTLTDFVLVDQLNLEFRPGFAVLTGETGAGKSILLDAIALVLGERADAGVVRAGQERAEVSAEFDSTGLPDLLAWLDEHDLAGEDGQLLLRRVVEAGGRSRAFINGRPATVQQLKQVGEFLVDIHGQHAHYSLLKAVEQRRMLDAFACRDEQSAPLVRQVAEAWQAWREMQVRRQQSESQGEAQALERSALKSTLAELEGLAFTPDGWTELQDEHRRMAHAAELLQGAQSAVDALDGEQAGVLVQLRAVRSRLAELVEIDSTLQGIHASLDGASDAMQDAARELRRYGERLELDPEALALAESRLAAIQAAARKYQVRPESLPDVLQQARNRLQELGESADAAALADAETQLELAYLKLAKQLSNVRAKAGKQLSKAVTETMQQLSMSGGCFEVALLTGQPSAFGLEEIEFRVSPHAGQSMQGLAKTASGGELSRLGLALQTVLSAVSAAPTLIFDEVDAGIGGSVAEIVGRLLAEQGRNRQVLCVTHLPQVAACAAWHYQVSKVSEGKQVRTQVKLLESDARVDEVARMLGGVKMTEATRKHAEEMLAGGR